MKLLIVEDEPRTREGIKKIVESCLKNITIATAVNGKDAYDLCQVEDFDVIFTDIKMPIMTGLEFLSKIDKRNKQIVIISGYNDFEYAKEAIKNNVVDYLLKPVDVFKLRDLLYAIEKKYISRNTQALKKYLLEYEYINDATKESLANRLFKENYYYIIKIQSTTEEKLGFKIKELEEEIGLVKYGFNLIDDLYLIYSSNDKSQLSEVKESLESLIVNDYFSTNIIDDKSTIYQEFKEILSASPEKNEGNIIISTVKNYIDHNYQSNINLNTLCELVYVHPTYLSKLFRKETGMTITDYIVDVRISKAKILLKDPKNRIYEVAKLTGFKDSKYFANVFKQVVGMTPMEFKNNNE